LVGITRCRLTKRASTSGATMELPVRLAPTEDVCPGGLNHDGCPVDGTGIGLKEVAPRARVLRPTVSRECLTNSPTEARSPNASYSEGCVLTISRAVNRAGSVPRARAVTETTSVPAERERCVTNCSQRLGLQRILSGHARSSSLGAVRVSCNRVSRAASSRAPRSLASRKKDASHCS
jgi:hypothetical protein